MDSFFSPIRNLSPFSLILFYIINIILYIFCFTVPFFSILPTNWPIWITISHLIFLLIYLVLQNFSSSSTSPFVSIFLTHLWRNAVLLLFFSGVTISLYKIISHPTSQPLSISEILNYYWILPLLTASQSLFITKGINRKTKLFIGSSSILAFLIILKSLYLQFWATPLSILQQTQPQLANTIKSWFHLFSIHESSVIFIALIIPLPLTAVLSSSRFKSSVTPVFYLSAILCFTAIAFSDSHYALIITAIGTSLTLLLTGNKKTFLTFLLFSLFFFVYVPDKNPHLSYGDSFSENQRRELLQVHFEVFKDHIFFGAGIQKNEKYLLKYYQKTGASQKTLSKAPNTYVQLLASFGLFGFLLYMAFIASPLLMTLQLIGEIPKSHYWYQTFALGALLLQLNFHVLGLFQWTLTLSAPLFLFMFTLSIVSHLDKHYSTGVVPDDHSL